MRTADDVGGGTARDRHARALLDLLRDVAATTGTKPAQVALAWLLAQPRVVVIPGASSVEQLEFNVAAAELELTDDELEVLEADYLPHAPSGF